MFVTALLAVSLAAPVPKAKASELYFPTVEGTKRVMQMTFDGRTSELTETVSKVVEKDGTYTVTVSRDIGATEDSYDVEVSAIGAYRITPVGHEKGEPLRLYKLPAKPGDTWTIERDGPGGKMKITYTVGKEEVVTVPAGKFNAFAVTLEADNGTRILTTTSWYAPNVGVVKVVTSNDGTERVQELKEFTPGKAK